MIDLDAGGRRLNRPPERALMKARIGSPFQPKVAFSWSEGLPNGAKTV
jgi:hypothetical protein